MVHGSFGSARPFARIHPLGYGRVMAGNSRHFDALAKDGRARPQPCRYDTSEARALAPEGPHQLAMTYSKWLEPVFSARVPPTRLKSCPPVLNGQTPSTGETPERLEHAARSQPPQTPGRVRSQHDPAFSSSVWR